MQPPPPPPQDSSSAPPPPPPQEDNSPLLAIPPPPPRQEGDSPLSVMPTPSSSLPQDSSPNPSSPNPSPPTAKILVSPLLKGSASPPATMDKPSATISSTEIKPKRKSRFSPMTVDPLQETSSPPSRGPSEYKPDVAKATSFSSRNDGTHPRYTSSASFSSAGSKPLTANEWEKTTFVGDASGEKRIKFLKLMGLGKSTKIEAKPDCPEKASEDAAQRQKVLADMEKQYEVGRKRQHRLN